MMKLATWVVVVLAGVAFRGATIAEADESPRKSDAAQTAAVLASVSERFKTESTEETPDFQRHVAPLLGRLGCNGRSCHGSFQGRGGFRLSLFGYDFKFDHDSLVGGETPRVNREQPDESLIIEKPTDESIHEGGQRFTKGSWQHHVLRRWIATGATYDTSRIQPLRTLIVEPAELVSNKPGEVVQVKAIAVWPDGAREDVTALCRFQSNDEQVVKIDENGALTTGDVGDTHVVVFYDNAVVPIPVLRPVSDKIGVNYPSVAAPTKVDELVIQKLRKLGIVPAGLCTDAEFLRRASLDLTGTLPSAADVEAFLRNSSPNKRAEKIDELLSTPAYAAWWTTKLCDFTGNNDRQLNNVNNVAPNGASQGWYDWIYKRVAENEPYDKIAEGIILGQSRKPEQSYTDFCREMSDLYRPGADGQFADRPSMPYYWARQNIRQTEDKAIAFAYSFMGVRIQCAQCHKHPFDQWSKEDFDQFKPFFAYVRFAQNGPKAEMQAILEDCGLTDLRGNELRKKLPDLLKEGKTVPFAEIVATSATPAKKAEPRKKGKGAKESKTPQPPQGATARLLNGQIVQLADYKDARVPLMEWLRAADNPYFAKAFVNRVWATYFNAGIVEPPDDMSLANPPRNQALLDHLAAGFIEHKFDMKWVHREICNSASYQRGWQTNSTNEKDEKNFSRAVPRRLPAEVAVDAFQIAVASDEKAAQALSTLKGRSILVAGSSASNRGNGGNFALQVFGRSTRESNCDCDRSTEASLLQTVFLQNDSTVVSALSGGRDTWIGQLQQQTKGRPAEENSTVEKRRTEAKRDLARLKVRLERAEKEKAEDQVARLKTRIEQVEKSLQSIPEQAEKAEPVEPLDHAQIVRQAYLRTLSRYPTDEESTRCVEFMASSENSVEGAKGILWALINTKEFIVNH